MMAESYTIETEHDSGAWHQWLGGRNMPPVPGTSGMRDNSDNSLTNQVYRVIMWQSDPEGGGGDGIA